MEKDWHTIYSSNKPHNIELVKGLLSDYNIESVEINKQDSSYLFGDIDLYVKSENVIRSKHLIEKNKI